MTTPAAYISTNINARGERMFRVVHDGMAHCADTENLATAVSCFCGFFHARPIPMYDGDEGRWYTSTTDWMLTNKAELHAAIDSGKFSAS